MASLPLLPSNSALKPTSFSRIPSRVSLGCSSIRPQVDPQGLVENIHLISLSKEGKLKDAHEFMKIMETSGITVDSHSYEVLLEACGKMKSLSFGKSLHYRLQRHIENSYNCPKTLSGSLGRSVIKMYLDCDCMVDAWKLFDSMPEKDLASWHMMIAAYAEHGLTSEALELFVKMHMGGTDPDSAVCVSLIRAISSPNLKIGRQIHSYAFRSGLLPDVKIDSALISMYIRCKWLGSSVVIFERMEEKNVVSWTDLIVGFTQEGRCKEALALFQEMIENAVELDQFAFSIALKACSKLGYFDTASQIHGYTMKLAMNSDVSVGTPLVDFYFKCGSLEEACQAFKGISCPNDASWSALITGYSLNGKYEECFTLFEHLRSKAHEMNSFIYTSLFQACSSLVDLNSGCQLHCDAIKRGLIAQLQGESALVTMYSKCGRLDDAYRAFELIDKPDTVAWSAMIAGAAYHGRAYEALQLFDKMLSCGSRPNSITFVTIFTACSHSGLVSEAWKYFDLMIKDYSVQPTVDHYNCMVDAYCRSGLLNEAFELVQDMKFKPDGMTWKIILSGCCAHGDIKLGKIAGENLLQEDPKDTAGYILLFNLYASAGRWQEAASVRKLMNERNVRKELGCSWITVKGKVSRFIVGDRHHPLTTEIYSKLKELNKSFVEAGASLPRSNVCSDLNEERNGQLLEHGEKLAISYGLISTSSGVPILVFKNLRVCSDCHEFTKVVSKITGREIVIRDSCRFHHFKEGKCSCRNYW